MPRAVAAGRLVDPTTELREVGGDRTEPVRCDLDVEPVARLVDEGAGLPERLREYERGEVAEVGSDGGRRPVVAIGERDCGRDDRPGVAAPVQAVPDGLL